MRQPHWCPLQSSDATKEHEEAMKGMQQDGTVLWNRVLPTLDGVGMKVVVIGGRAVIQITAPWVNKDGVKTDQVDHHFHLEDLKLNS